jgi:Ca-activated chloride channel homolog
MNLKAARSFVAGLLVIVFAASLSPLPCARAYAQQTGTSTQRRGKNGPSSDSTSTDKQDSSAQSSSSADDGSANSQPSKPPQQTTRVVRKTTVPAPQRDQMSSVSQDSRQSAANQSQKRSDDSKSKAPAFDRPPLNSDSQSAQDQSPPQTQTDRGASQQNPSRSDRTARQDPAVDDQDEQQGRPNKPQPSLRRPQDSRAPNQNTQSGSGDYRQQPPVLRRGDSQTDEVRAPQAGQSNQRQSGGDDDVVRLESTLVNIPLLVSDRSGRYVPQLSKRDFMLYEDGVKQEIASFGSEQVPFNVALLLDVSPSVAGSIEDIQDAALAFVRQLREQDRVMVVSFDRRTHYLSDLTSDRRQLESAIRSISTGSGTSVYDTVYEVVSRRLRGVEGRKAMILLSDGEDTTSNRASYDDAIDIVTESDVLVYGLRYPGTGGGGHIRIDPWPQRMPRMPIPFPMPFPWPRTPVPRRPRGPLVDSGSNWAGGQSWPRRHGGDFMADIAAAGGGPVYDAQNVGDMSRLASRIAEELRHVYVLSYYPTKPLSAGGYRSIRVSVAGRDDIAVRHRKGYNAGTVNAQTTTH